MAKNKKFNYSKFKEIWLGLMEVKSFYDKVYLEQDINDAYTLFKTDPMKHKSVKRWMEFFYVDFTEEKHPYKLKNG